MKIGVLSEFFPPEEATLPATVAGELVARGHDVRVLTTFPNYPAGVLFEGYRQRWRHTERRGELLVRRTPVFCSHDASGLRRAATFASFAATSSAAASYLRECDVVYVYATPLTAASAAAMANALYEVPYVLHIQDLWPESVTESGMAGGARTQWLLERGIHRSAAVLYRRAAHLIAIAPSMATLLGARGVPENKISVIHNWEPGDDVPTPPADGAVRSWLGRPDRTLAVFAGNLGQVQDLETVVRAAALVRDEAMVDVALVGSGSAEGRLRALAEDVAADNVRFLGEVDVARMPAVYAASDYQLVTLLDRPVFHATIPSKLGAVLAHGCPVITTVPGDVAAMTASGGFGIACAPEDPVALAAAFRQAGAAPGDARAAMARAARTYYRSSMSRQAGIDGIESVLADAARSRERVRA